MAQSASGDDLFIVDGRDLSFRSVDLFGHVALDPGRDTAWIAGYDGLVTKVGGSDLHTESVDLGPGRSITTVAVDPIRELLYLGEFFADEIYEVDATLATRSAPIGGGVVGVRSIAVDPLQARLFASLYTTCEDCELMPELWSFDAASLAALGSAGLFGEVAGPVASEPAAGRVWMLAGNAPWGHSLEAFAAANLSLIARIPDSPTGDLLFRAYTVNPATGRGHALASAFSSVEMATLDVTPVSPVVQSPLPGDNTDDVAVDAATNHVYALSHHVDTPGSSTLSERDEGEATPVPITTSLWNEAPQPDGSVVVHFSATTGWPLPVRQIYWQVDALDGPWSPTTPAGDAGTATLALTPGTHRVHAFAVDGQEATLGHLQTKNPIVGPVASLEISVPLVPQCSNGIDDDGDGAIDFPADSRCTGPLDDDEARNPGCGLGAEIALALAALMVTRRRRSAARR
jgi:hypothetical protein